MDYYSLGSSPVNESCSQVGDKNYDMASVLECEAYKNQLERLFENLLDGSMYFDIKEFPHDFGYYKEVCINFQQDSVEEDIAVSIMDNLPEEWDIESLEELGRYDG